MHIVIASFETCSLTIWTIEYQNCKTIWKQFRETFQDSKFRFCVLEMTLATDYDEMESNRVGII